MHKGTFKLAFEIVGGDETNGDFLNELVLDNFVKIEPLGKKVEHDMNEQRTSIFNEEHGPPPNLRAEILEIQHRTIRETEIVQRFGVVLERDAIRPWSALRKQSFQVMTI